MELSLPGPIPEIFISNIFTPKSKTFFKTNSVESWAEKGVDFFAPLNPQLPEEAQQKTFPFTSVKEIIEKIHINKSINKKKVNLVKLNTLN